MTSTGFFHGSVDTQFLQDLEEVVLCTFVATCTDTLGRGRWMKRWMGCRVPIFCGKMLVVGGCRLVQNPSKSHSGINCHHTFYATRLQEVLGGLCVKTRGFWVLQLPGRLKRRRNSFSRNVRWICPELSIWWWDDSKVSWEANKRCGEKSTICGWWFGTFGLFFHMLGMSSSQLTNSIIFQRGRYTTNQIMNWLLSLLSSCIQKQTGWRSLLHDVGMLLVFLRGWVETTTNLHQTSRADYRLWMGKQDFGYSSGAKETRGCGILSDWPPKNWMLHDGLSAWFFSFKFFRSGGRVPSYSTSKARRIVEWLWRSPIHIYAYPYPLGILSDISGDMIGLINLVETCSQDGFTFWCPEQA